MLWSDNKIIDVIPTPEGNVVIVTCIVEAVLIPKCDHLSKLKTGIITKAFKNVSKET